MATSRHDAVSVAQVAPNEYTITQGQNELRLNESQLERLTSVLLDFVLDSDDWVDAEAGGAT